MSDKLICNCCQSSHINQNNNVNNFHHFECKDCLYEFFMPINNDEVRIDNKLYENDSDYKNDLTISPNYNSLIMWSHKKAFQFIKRKKENFSVLDFGTYNGFFVRFLKDRGIKAFGYDFNNNSIDAGIKLYNLKNYITTNLTEFNIKKFDCITAFEVIEHLDDINEFILTIKKLLSDDGYIILSTPNNKMVWRPPLDFPPHHLSRFSSHSLCRLFENNGFEIVKTYQQMSIFDLIRNFAGILFRDKNSNSLKGGEFKNSKLTNTLKRILNSSREIFYILFFPFNLILHLCGFRYISQVIIAKKIK